MPLFLEDAAVVLARIERRLLTGGANRVSLVLANGQTVHVRRSDGWRTHHGRSRPAGLGPDEIVEFRQYGYHGSAPWLPARFVPWAKATRNHARVTHWRRAK